VQDRGGGGDDDVSQLISKEDREELLNRKIEQMKKRNEELLQKHLVCTLTYVCVIMFGYFQILNRRCGTEALFFLMLYCLDVYFVFLKIIDRLVDSYEFEIVCFAYFVLYKVR